MGPLSTMSSSLSLLLSLLLPLLTLLPTTVSSQDIIIPGIDTVEDPGEEAVVLPYWNNRLWKILKRKQTGFVGGKFRVLSKRGFLGARVRRVFAETPINKCSIMDENGRCREPFSISTYG